MATMEDNGNIGLLKPTSSSNEDLSEYTDADESISAPTEFLAELYRETPTRIMYDSTHQLRKKCYLGSGAKLHRSTSDQLKEIITNGNDKFLSAVMLKDYETALKYCKLILQYEPNNVTAKEFYPLILEKLQQIKEDEDVNNDSEDEDNDDSSSSSASSDSETSTSDDSSEDQEEEDCDGIEEQAVDKRSKGSSDGDATTGSYSSLEDDEAEIDQLAALAAKYHIDNMDFGNGNKIYSTNMKSSMDSNIFKNNTLSTENIHIPFGSSDSESPTEPVSQQTIAMLRAKVVPNNI